MSPHWEYKAPVVDAIEALSKALKMQAYSSALHNLCPLCATIIVQGSAMQRKVMINAARLCMKNL